MTGIILQARMGSSRLPGKVLKPLGGVTMLEYIMRRLEHLKTESVVRVIATSTKSTDDKIAELCQKKCYNCFRGNEQNVLERYYQCAQTYKMDVVIRLTGDNPFVDVEEIDRLIEMLEQGEADYLNSFAALPYGVGAEIFTFAALRKCYEESSQPHHFEHVNEYILEHPEMFKIQYLTVEKGKNMPNIRLTVDTQEDYQRARRIVAHSGETYITTQEAIRLCLQYA